MRPKNPRGVLFGRIPGWLIPSFSAALEKLSSRAIQQICIADED